MVEPVARLTIVGSGTLVPSGVRRSPSHLLEAADRTILLDCGPGTVHGLAALGLPWERLTHVGVTHFHVDHVADLPALLTAFRHGLVGPRSEPLALFGPPGLRSLLTRMGSVTGSALLDQDFPVVVHEIDPDSDLTLRTGSSEAESERRVGGSVVVRAVSTPHTSESIAYRISGAWGSVGYTGDTGPSEALAEAMAGVDVLVAECTLPDAVDSATHLSPRTAAALARAAAPRLLVLTHVFPPGDPDAVAGAVRAAYGGRVSAAWDGLSIRVTNDSVTVDRPERAL